ncbi:hypothetical protein, partial [Enterobacter sp. 04-C-12-SI-ECC]
DGGVSGRSPERGICDAAACAVLQMHILSGSGHRETAKKTGRHARNSIKLDYSQSSITASWNDDHRP